MNEEQPIKHKPRFVVPLMILLLLLTPCAVGSFLFVTCFTNFRLH